MGREKHVKPVEKRIEEAVAIARAIAPFGVCPEHSKAREILDGAYNVFVAKHRRAGKSMQEAAKLWNAEKKKMPPERLKEYEFWGVLNRYVSGIEEIVVDELNRRVASEAETQNFARRLCDELRGDDGSEIESWSLVRITVDMNNQPPGLPQEELGAMEAFARESWAEYLAETGATQGVSTQ
eukprot:jgi/Tetstr1/454220/TSEL_041139.t1